MVPNSMVLQWENVQGNAQLALEMGGHPPETVTQLERDVALTAAALTAAGVEFDPAALLEEARARATATLGDRLGLITVYDDVDGLGPRDPAVDVDTIGTALTEALSAAQPPIGPPIEPPSNSPANPGGN